MSRIGVIQQAAVDLPDGELDEDGRRRAQGEAHKLAGTLGTYGFSQGSYLARELEQTGLSGEDLGRDQAHRVAHLVKGPPRGAGPTRARSAHRLRRRLGRAPAAGRRR